MTKEEMMDAVKKCAAALGHAPSFAEFRRHAKVNKRQIQKNFGTYTQMMAASELERHGSGSVVSMKTLFLEWAGIVRKLGKIPSMSQYELESKYSVRPMIRRFTLWNAVPKSMLDFARKEGLEREWEDVTMIIGEHLEGVERRARTCGLTSRAPARPQIMLDRPIFGQPMRAPLCCAPTNENGVVFAFGTVARALGFSILRIQIECPDCTALRHMGNNQWQLARIEFEYESRNFLTHMHSPTAADLIVCWRHNWPDCPLEVIELQSVGEIWKGHAQPEWEAGLSDAGKNQALETMTATPASQYEGSLDLLSAGASGINAI